MRLQARTGFDPRALGAQCDVCPLRSADGLPVGGVVPRVARLLVIGEGPGRSEEESGKPFTGESGRRLDAACKSTGCDRETDLAIVNATCCRPTGKLSEKEWRTAVACCRPRLVAELAGAPAARWALLLGRRALTAFSGINDPVIHWVGSEVGGLDPLGALAGIACVHPAFALRGEPAWISVFYRLFDRAWAFASRARSPMPWPELHYDPTPAAVKALEALRARAVRIGGPVAFDVETAGTDPADPLTAVGLADLDGAVSIPWPPARWFGKQRGAKVLGIVKAILAHPRIRKVAHNGIYDLSSLQAHGLPIANYTDDTILAHHVVAPGLPHRLQIAYALECGGEAWKTLFHAIGDEKGSERFAKALETEKTRRELCSYNAKDCAATVRLHHAMTAALAHVNSGPKLYAGYLRRSLISLRMRDAGAAANVGALEAHDRELSTRLEAARAALQAIAAQAGWDMRTKPTKKKPARPVHFNPGSGAHLARLFFRHLGCKPVAYSEDTGAPSLNSKALHSYLIDPSTLVREAAREVVLYRRWQKLLRTYVQGLAYDRATGLIHADPKVWGTKTGRWSYGSKGNSFNPQTLPKPRWEKDSAGQKVLAAPGLRNLVKPRAAGSWIVEADYSQLEARIVALLAGDQPLLDVFARGEDLHTWTAIALFGDSAKGDKQLRDLAKRGRYAWQYGAEPVTAWRALVVEIPGLQLRDVERLWKRLNAVHPAIVRYHDQSLRKARIDDFVETPLSGRRFFFFGAVEPSKVYNLPVQGTGADLIDAAIEGVAAEFDWRREWILFQVHDSLVCEARDPARAARILKKHMERPVFLHGRRIVFPIDFKVSPVDWGSVEECHSIGDIERKVRGQ